jgi:hypothetical protein
MQKLWSINTRESVCKKKKKIRTAFAELPNIYIRRDINSVWEFHGQRLYVYFR